MKDILDHLNLPDELREEYSAKDDFSDDDRKAIFEAHNTALFNQHREALANDADYTKPFFDQGHTEAMKSMRARIVAALEKHGFDGPTADDEGEIPTVKLVERFGETFQTKVKSKSGGNKELEEKLIERNKRIKELEEGVKNRTLPEIKELADELNAIKAEYEANATQTALTAQFTKNYGNLSATEAAVIGIKRGKDFGWKFGPFGENGAMKWVTNAGNNILNEAGTAILQQSEIISILEQGLTAESNGGNQGGGGSQTPPPPVKVDPVLARRQKYADDTIKAASELNR